MKVLTDQQHYQDIAEAIRAKTGKEGTLKPAQMAQELNDLNIDLEEAYITPTTEQQEILPGPEFYGFSRILVDAAPESGGDSYSSADDLTFGDDYTEEEIETGLLDYSSGTDEDAIGLPAIPDGAHQILLRKANVGTSLRYYYYDVLREVETDVPASIYCAGGHVDQGDGYLGCSWSVFIYSESSGRYRAKADGGEWYSWKPFEGLQQLLNVGSGHNADKECHLRDTLSGIVKYDCGTFSSLEALAEAMASYGATAKEERGDTFIALVSSSQITFDGMNVGNVDGSPMTIYECTSEDRSTWKEIGQTDGSYSADGYALTWNSHDLLDSTGENVTYEASEAPVAETELATVAKPTDRNETYTIDGNSVNAMVSAAQKITGTQESMTPEEAANILNDYYSGPTAEDEVF